jgi:hypothetical protein
MSTLIISMNAAYVFLMIKNPKYLLDLFKNANCVIIPAKYFTKTIVVISIVTYAG